MTDYVIVEYTDGKVGIYQSLDGVPEQPFKRVTWIHRHPVVIRLMLNLEQGKDAMRIA